MSLLSTFLLHNTVEKLLNSSQLFLHFGEIITQAGHPSCHQIASKSHHFRLATQMWELKATSNMQFSVFEPRFAILAGVFDGFYLCPSSRPISFFSGRLGNLRVTWKDTSRCALNSRQALSLHLWRALFSNLCLFWVVKNEWVDETDRSLHLHDLPTACYFGVLDVP